MLSTCRGTRKQTRGRWGAKSKGADGNSSSEGYQGSIKPHPMGRLTRLNITYFYSDWQQAAFQGLSLWSFMSPSSCEPFLKKGWRC